MKKRKLAGGTPGNGDVISAKGIYLDMQPAEATYDGIALGEHARSGEASIRISDAEIASVHESAEACLGDTSAADAAYSTSQAYADGIANKTCVTVQFMALIRTNSRARGESSASKRKLDASLLWV